MALAQMAASGSVGGWLDALALIVLFLILRGKLIPVWALVLLAAGGGWLLG